jgi:hypothetical protein
MDPSDPIYRLCVEMAETLVPDVCRIIMDHLEQIHIDEGRRKWKEKMGQLNKLYKNTFYNSLIEGGREYVCAIALPRNRGFFKFNYRESEDEGWRTRIYNWKKIENNPYPLESFRLPINYYNTRLWL